MTPFESAMLYLLLLGWFSLPDKKPARKRSQRYMRIIEMRQMPSASRTI